MSLAASLTPIDDPAALEPRWRALEARARGTSFFLGWTWMGSWLAACRAASIPLPALFALRDEGGRDVALALIGRGRARRSFGAVPALWLNETGVAEGDRPYVEYNDLLCAAGREAEARRAFGAAMAAEKGWSALHLSGVEDEAAFDAVPGIRRKRVEDRSPAYFADLAAVRAAGGDYLSLLSSNTRGQIRRSLKEEAAPPVPEQAGDGETVVLWLDEMARLNAGRHADNAWEAAFFRGFARRIALAGLEDGSVELLRIGAGGEALGYLLNFLRGGRVMNYQSAFTAPRGPKSKPGLMCHAAAIVHHAERGQALYSFLAGGDRYKQSLATGAEQLHWLVLERFDPRLELEALARRLLKK